MDRYANIIRGQMFGHTHWDSFQIEHSSVPGEFSGVAIENPPLTTGSSLYPSYRIYQMDRVSYVINDYVQYRFKLEDANKNDNPSWRIAYRFKNYYGVNEYNENAYALIAEKIKANETYFKKFAKMAYSEGPRSTALSRRYLAMKDNIYCRLTTANFYEYENCTGGMNFTISESYLFSLMMKYLLPPWEYVA